MKANITEAIKEAIMNNKANIDCETNGDIYITREGKDYVVTYFYTTGKAVVKFVTKDVEALVSYVQGFYDAISI